MDTAAIPVPSPSEAGTRSTQPYRLRWVVAAVVLAANVMDLLDGTIVNIAAPSVHRDLGGGANTIQWLSAAYTLAFAVLLIAGARLGDILGRRRLFLVGSAGFTLFSAACSAAPSISVLIAFRALQGAFGGLMIPQGFGLMKQVFADDAEFDKATGLFGPATGVAMLAAPIVAGALIDANLFGSGWRLVFLINIPIGALSFPLAIHALPRGATHPDVKLDIGGVFLVGLGLVAIIYPLIQGRTEGWPAWCFAVLAAGLILLMAFLRHERRRGHDPLIEPSLLSNRTYLSGVAVALALFGAFGGLLLCVSLYGQLGEGWSPIHAGLTFDADGPRDDPRHGRVSHGRQPARTSLAPHRDPAHRRRHGRTWFDPHRGAHRLELGPCPQPLSHRRRRRCQHRSAIPLHPHEREHGRGRIRCRRLGSRATTLYLARSRGPGHHLLLELRPPPSDRCTPGHGLGLPGTSRSCFLPRVPIAHAPARRTGSNEHRGRGPRELGPLRHQRPRSNAVLDELAWRAPCGCFRQCAMLFGYLRLTPVATRQFCDRGARLVDWVRDWWQRRLA